MGQLEPASGARPGGERILVTSALPYANGPIHMGHLAGAYLPADIYCRYQRLKGRDVIYICGSDEHGVPIMLRARAEGVDPQEIVDRYHAMNRDAFAGFGMSFDHYGRTSAPVHHETSQGFFRRLARDGAFLPRTELQLYDPEAKMFLADRFVRGTCPNAACAYDDAYGDQCEKCGRSLSPKELINPRSAITNATPVLEETTHLYLPLQSCQQWLEEWISQHGQWKPNVLGQVRSWFAEGLAERAMTRDLPWGVPVPEDVAADMGFDPTGKVLYVWFDAPIGYISATREWAAAIGDPERWQAYWKDPGTKLVHFIGKDNIVFHCIIFPAMLKLHGDYVLPMDVPANEFLNLKGLKFSTSRGVAVWLHEYLESFPPDYLRYVLTTIMPETRDSDFGWDDFQARVNNELADTFGNFANRSLTFAAKHFDGVVPALEQPSGLDRATLAALAELPARVGNCIETYRFRDAASEIMAMGRLANKYFNDSEPWATRKTDMRACGNAIYTSLQICASLSILFEPIVPFSCARLREMLALRSVRPSDRVGEGDLGWDEAARPLLPPGHKLGEPQILVSKVEDEAIQAQVAKLEGGQAMPEGPPYADLGSTIAYDDFAKLDLRVGKVLEADRVEKSKKLIRCEVDLGFERRQVLAGVAEHLTPEDLLGKLVVVVANLAPRKMMGLESCGMILMAEDRSGKLTPVLASGEPGGTVK